MEFFLMTWAILIGGVLLLTPNGIEIIVTNPVLRIGIGAVSILLGAIPIIFREYEDISLIQKIMEKEMKKIEAQLETILERLPPLPQPTSTK